MRLRYLAAGPLVAVAMFGTTAAAWPSGTAAMPQAPPALTASALSARYAADARAIGTAEQAAVRDGDRPLAGALARLRSRHVLFFNPNGQGVAAMVIGNLATANRVAILVPGSDTTLATFFSRGSSSPGGRPDTDSAGCTSPDGPRPRHAVVMRVRAGVRRAREGLRIVAGLWTRLLASPSLRVGLRRLIEPVLPNLPVVSLAELPPYIKLSAVATWETSHAA